MSEAGMPEPEIIRGGITIDNIGSIPIRELLELFGVLEKFDETTIGRMKILAKKTVNNPDKKSIFLADVLIVVGEKIEMFISFVEVIDTFFSVKTMISKILKI